MKEGPDKPPEDGVKIIKELLEDAGIETDTEAYRQSMPITRRHAA